MSNHYIEEKVEDALASVIVAQTSGTLSGVAITGGTLDGFSIYKGNSLEDMDFPYVSVVARTVSPNELRVAAATGNQVATVYVQVCGHKGDATTSRAAHASAAGAVRDILYMDDDTDTGTGLKVLMNAAGVADLTVMRTFPGVSSRGVQGGALVTETQIEIKAFVQ